ncbi:NAD(P)H-hydrate dehydratase [Zongyangia hominis]|uniref:Bifunctional NAD(P)H-hydrate repair enzyme n=1 Tax=Zongyangia hominis TaxID=2763677 RepID=A0A926I6I5_9FIRM|nr:NAD(P)H-hydrate dehydratase [Zongyangia hominis]MBC8570089.1 NAD(P)H-hydrate dehydratase [Zongyangia hominis]
MAIATSQEMKQIEAGSIPYGQTYLSLMQNAGDGVTRVILDRMDVKRKRCLILCGRGNNGGDGFVVAKNLKDAGAELLVALLHGEPATPDAITMYERAREDGVGIVRYEENRELIEQWARDCDLAVDAVYGTGFHGELDPETQKLSGLLREGKGRVFAVDIPSGVAANTGRVASDAVWADCTVTFDCYKPAHFLMEAASYCGEVVLTDIGIDPRVHGEVSLSHVHLTKEFVFSHLKKRPPNSHKGTYGRLLNLCGSVGMCGAAIMSALSALRCGTGLVTLGTVGELTIPVSVRLTESLFLPLCQNADGRISAQNLPIVLERLSKSDACLIGCGLGLDEDTVELTRGVIIKADCPMVVDADGINALAKDIDIIKKAKAPLILTPHPGEMSRLCGRSVSEIAANRMEIGAAFAKEYGVTLVLKGHNTLVFSPEGKVYINTTGNPGLSKGGSGDILAGMIASFLAQGLPADVAAACGVFLHGYAADRCAARLSQYAMLPTDILNDLAAIFAENGR